MVQLVLEKTPKRKLEKHIQKDILEYLRSINCSVDVITSGAFMRGGISDIIGCTATGHFLAVEVKRPGGKLTALQRAYFNEKESLTEGAICIMATSVEDLKNQLKPWSALL